MGLYRVGRYPTALELLLFATMLAAGVVIVYSLWLMLVTLAFWFVKVDNFTEVFYTFYETGRFPISVYRGWIRLLLTFVVPIAFLTTFPAAMLLGRLAPAYAAVSVAMALGLFVGATRFWNFAIRFIPARAVNKRQGIRVKLFL